MSMRGRPKFRHANAMHAVPVAGRPPDANQSHHHKQRIASAERNYRRYLALARQASATGDSIEMENFYQHAEHYLRVIRAGGSTND
jgi:hypothetical protein